MNKEDKTVFIASSLLAVIGLGLMYASTTYLEPDSYEISEIDESMIGEPVKIKGKVENPVSTEEHLFFDLNDGEKIEIAMFNTEKSVKAGKEAFVTGDVSMYEGKINIVAEEIDSSP